MADLLQTAFRIARTRQPVLDDLEGVLDEMDNDTRLTFIRDLQRREQSSLYQAAMGREVSIDDMVPPSTAPFVEVIHEGRNTLPSFNYFQKRFCRSPYNDKELYGYNHNQPLIMTTVGPGYFVAYDDENRGEVAIDYRRVPTEHPAVWPEIRPNETRLSRFVYAGTVDMMRRLSKHVTIGRAHKGDKALPAWFVLCRVEW